MSVANTTSEPKIAYPVILLFFFFNYDFSSPSDGFNYDFSSLSDGGSIEEESPEPLECDDLLEHLLQFQQPALPPLSPPYPHPQCHSHLHERFLTTDSEEEDEDEEEEDSLEPSHEHPVGLKVQVSICSFFSEVPFSGYDKCTV